MLSTALLSPTVHRAEAPQTGYPKQTVDLVEQRIIMQAEVTSDHQIVSLPESDCSYSEKFPPCVQLESPQV